MILLRFVLCTLRVYADVSKSALNEDVPREVMKRTADHTIQIYGTPSSFNLEAKSAASETSMVKGIQASGSEKIIHLQLTVRTGLVASVLTSSRFVWNMW